MEQKIIERVEKEVECPVCLEVFEKPILLDCLHVFCTACLERDHLKQLRCREDHIIREGKVKCSVCKALSKVPDGGVKDFKSAFHINSLLEIVESHGKTKHNCPQHEDRELELYCETCKKLVCINCVIRRGKHHDHEHQVLEEAFKKFKAEVGSSQTRLSKQMIDTEQAFKTLHAYRNGVHEKQRALADGLKKDVRKSLLMSQVYQITRRKIKDLATEEEKLKNIHSQLKGCFDYLKNSLECGDHYHVLDMKAKVMVKIKSLNAPIQSDLFFAVLSDTPAVGYSMNTMLCRGEFDSIPVKERELAI